MTQPPNGDVTGAPSAPPAHQEQPTSPGPVGTPPAGQHPEAMIPPPAPGYPPYQAPAAPKKKRGLMIASIVLAAALLLCAGGGVAAFLTLRDAESGTGAKEPTVAVDDFLTAVYKERDAKKASAFVCSSSRDDKKIAAKVAEVEKYAAGYQNPRFRWTSPKVDNQTGERATVTTKVTMTTADEKVAEQDLRFTVVQKTGWWVCEVA
jgi:flagellar basal body-associated protein FliL